MACKDRTKDLLKPTLEWSLEMLGNQLTPKTLVSSEDKTQFLADNLSTTYNVMTWMIISWLSLTRKRRNLKEIR